MYRLLGHLAYIFVPENNKNSSTMNKIVDRFLTNLFGLAEKVANKFEHSSEVPTVKCDIPRDTPKPHIRFSNDDKMVEGELWK